MEFVSFYVNIHAKKLKNQLCYIKLAFSIEKFKIKDSARDRAESISITLKLGQHELEQIR